MCRSNYRAIAERGGRVILKTKNYGEYIFTPKQVFASIAEAGAHQWDYVVVTTKALPDVSDDSEIIVPLVTRGKSCIVLIQNGVSPRQTHCFKVSYWIAGWGRRALPQKIPRQPHFIGSYCYFS